MMLPLGINSSSTAKCRTASRPHFLNSVSPVPPAGSPVCTDPSPTTGYAEHHGPSRFPRPDRRRNASTSRLIRATPCRNVPRTSDGPDRVDSVGTDLSRVVRCLDSVPVPGRDRPDHNDIERDDQDRPQWVIRHPQEVGDDQEQRNDDCRRPGPHCTGEEAEGHHDPDDAQDDVDPTPRRDVELVRVVDTHDKQIVVGNGRDALKQSDNACGEQAIAAANVVPTAKPCRTG